MQIKQFEYTKANGDISSRKVIVLQPAKDYDHTIDISDVELPMAEEILGAELSRLHSEYMNNLKQLLSEFGLENNIRNFKTNRMSNITEGNL